MSWNGIRSTFQWLLLLLLIGVIAAGAIGLHLWTAKDGILAAAIQRKLAEVLPECRTEFEAMRFVDASHLELTHFTMRSKLTNAQLIHIPRIVVGYDGALLRSHRRIVIRDVLANSPEVMLIRAYDNHWNWEGFSLIQPPDSVSPNWTIRNGTIHVGFQNEFNGPIQRVSCQGIQAAFNALSHRRYDVEAKGVADALGGVTLAGVIDSTTGEWNVQGTAGEVRLGDALLDVVAEFVPQVGEQLAQLRHSNSQLPRGLAAGRREPLRTAAAADIPLGTGIENQVTSGPLLRADVALSFAAGRAAEGAPLDYQIEGTIRNGTLSDQLVPVALYDLSGEIQVTPRRVRIHQLQAANGPSTLFVDGLAEQMNGDWATQFTIRATRLSVDENVRTVLNDSWRKIYDLIRPTGTFDMELQLDRRPGEPVRYALQKFAAVDCRVLCDYFQYPVEKIRGEVTQNERQFAVNLQGEAAGKEVNVRGTIVPAGAQTEIDLIVSVPEFPVDSSVQNALRRPDQEAIREALRALRLSGTARNLQAHILRSPQTLHDLKIRLRGDLENGQLNFTGFPYELTNLSGRLVYDPLDRNAWIFEDLRGNHKDAVVTGEGEFDLTDAPGVLTLELALIGIPVNYELQEAATTASPELGVLWRDFEIGGTVDVEKVRVGWIPHTPADVTLEGIQWQNGHFVPAALPYRWDQVAGTLHWDGTRLRIHSLDGWHGDTYVRIDGSRPDAGKAYVDIPSDGSPTWTLHFDDLRLVRLNPDEELRRALPKVISDALASVEFKGLVNLQMALELSGEGTDSNTLTSAWRMHASLVDNSLTAGVPLSRVTGDLFVQRGSWDGKRLNMEGDISLESLRALDMPFHRVRGPFLVDGDRLWLGMPRAARDEGKYREPHRTSRLESQLYGGTVGLDADVLFNQPDGNTLYNVELNVWDVELAQWAADWKIYQRLMGKVNGNLKAEGRGSSATATTGDGWVQITPAAIWELPVFAQILSLSNFRQAGNTAFKYAYGEFTLHDGLFDFSKIHLIGDAIGFVGQGRVGYAGPRAQTVDLNFYSQANSPIPLLTSLVRLVADKWIRVVVGGTVSQPWAQISANIGPVETIRGLMQEVGPNPPPRNRPMPNAVGPRPLP